MEVKAFGLTHVGRQRQHNEDSFLVEDEARLFLVADGMGGHAAGEIASRIAVDSISEFIVHTKEDDGTWPHAYDEHYTPLDEPADGSGAHGQHARARSDAQGRAGCAAWARPSWPAMADDDIDVGRARRRLARLPDPRRTSSRASRTITPGSSSRCRPGCSPRRKPRSIPSAT